MQDLFYNTISSSVTLSKPGSLDVTWNNISEVRVLTSSLYWNGADYSNQILIFSGSNILAYFPIASTNLFHSVYLPLNITSSLPTSSYTTLLYSFTNIYSTTGSSYHIYDSSSAFYYVSESLTSSTEGGLSIITGHNHRLYLIGTGSYDTNIIIRDVTSGSVLSNVSSSDIAISSSFSPLQFHNYEATISIIGPAP